MQNERYRKAYQQILEGIKMTAADIGNEFPHYANGDTGKWTCSPAGDWTGGYWNGMLWLAAATTKDPQYVEWAHKWTELLKCRIDSQTVFRGFLFYYGAALGSILLEDHQGREIAVLSAKSIAKSFNPNAGLIPLGMEAEEAGNVGIAETNIDGVSATPLLLWAAKETGDATLANIAIRHALKNRDLSIREDGSVCQSASFDPSGNLVKRYTHKGFSDESTWGRAQAWAMMHYTVGYLWAKEERQLLETAIHVSDWWVNHLPEDGVAFWDFDDPAIPNTNRDTSATAIGASALLKLSSLINDKEKSAVYRSTAVKSINHLVSNYLVPEHEQDQRRPGMLLGGCFNKKLGVATDNELIWGSYYLFDSLCCLLGYLKPNKY
ncbi:glycoside hydrolase family 88 protein [Ammoniphilus resinae]|uniref:Unsaturated chondroitin disaccharide hydrolase n=1 Tax=Ammoniphilus resinae TaxID=861532 RepID=A0ABS4GKZ2_9BACL|nr:glycoside hydrolase family 88 protein [Ammoniphilus resinae]MBP1930938.1 unsaturated chondroitin disaccharide hydrolase [Ammoniphilus resinae]